MSRPSGAASYRAVLRSPGVLRPFVAVNLGRLSYATLPLSLLLTVQAATGSFAAAGIALGALSAATGIMPVKSRLIDRLGARRVLPVLAVAFAAALIVSAASAAAGVSTPVVYIGFGAAAGLASPPLGPSMRALWAALAPEPDARQRAYALDGSVEETIQVAGPLVVAGMLAVSTSAAALVVAAVLNVVGAIGVATSAATPSAGTPAPASRRARLVGPFTARGFGVRQRPQRQGRECPDRGGHGRQQLDVGVADVQRRFQLRRGRADGGLVRRIQREHTRQQDNHPQPGGPPTVSWSLSCTSRRNQLCTRATGRGMRCSLISPRPPACRLRHGTVTPRRAGRLSGQ